MNFWDEETISEYELFQDEAEEAQILADEMANHRPEVIEADDEIIEEINEESAFELDNREANVVFNARLRLEQARLYEMLINHNLFEGVDASPQAIENVQNELKAYIVARLEILLGLRERVVRKKEPELTSFNDVEVDWLKQLAYKGTKGASIYGQSSEPNEPEQLRPVSSKPKQTGLKPLSQSGAKGKAKAPVKKQSPLPKKPTKKIAKKRTVSEHPSKVKLSSPAHGVRKLTDEEAIAIAMEDLKATGGNTLDENLKNWGKLSAKEKAQKIKQSNSRDTNNVNRPSDALPMMDSTQLEAKYLQEQSVRSARPGANGFNMLLNHIITQQNKKE